MLSKSINQIKVTESPVVLAILDGWGHREENLDNAIKKANTPVMDSLWHAYPHTLISASGADVGLPNGQMGNSEVGHLTIGSGRIIQQELVRITNTVKNNQLNQVIALKELAAALFKTVFKILEFMSAFVKINDNIVAKLGAIMPDPLAIPEILINSSPMMISS